MKDDDKDEYGRIKVFGIETSIDGSRAYLVIGAAHVGTVVSTIYGSSGAWPCQYVAPEEVCTDPEAAKRLFIKQRSEKIARAREVLANLERGLQTVEAGHIVDWPEGKE